MQQAFGTVLYIVCAVAGLAALALLIGSGKTWSEYGKRGLLLDRDLPRGPAPGSIAAVAERDAEIRSMLEARNARRLRRGETPIDVDQELRRLTAGPPRIDTPPQIDASPRIDTSPQIDPSLRAEIRDLVVARNRRRARAGKPPLDVEQEIEREIRDFGHL
jgi:hypothetical protein